MLNLTRPGSIPRYLNHCFTSALCLQFVALIGLILTPGPAVSDNGKGGPYATSYVKQINIGIANNLHSLSDTSDPISLLAESEYPVKDEHPLGTDEAPDKSKETVEPITRKLPIWGEKVRAMGYELPLPFGAGVNLVYMEQGIDIKNEERWNFLMGGQWEITKRWQITAEGGVGNRRQIVVGSSFRF